MTIPTAFPRKVMGTHKARDIRPWQLRQPAEPPTTQIARMSASRIHQELPLPTNDHTAVFCIDRCVVQVPTPRALTLAIWLNTTQLLASDKKRRMMQNASIDCAWQRVMRMVS